jgi:hypothetical protein
MERHQLPQVKKQKALFAAAAAHGPLPPSASITNSIHSQNQKVVKSFLYDILFRAKNEKSMSKHGEAP